MAVKDYNVDPDLNITISGINIAEGCAPSGINNAIRQLMADVKEAGEAQSAKDAEQDAAIAAAQSSAEAKVSALEAFFRDLIENEKATLEAQIQNTVPVGTVVAFAANSTSDGFLHCNGAAVSRITYAGLFSVIGTIYGAGDGSTTFNLPNLMDGRYIRGGESDGVYIEPGLPNITGNVSIFDGFEINSVSGAFAKAANSAGGRSSAAGDGTPYDLWFSASNANAVFGRYSNDVVPKSLRMRYYIKY